MPEELKRRIKEGDIVTVNFTSSDSLFNVKVLYTPCAIGDSWILRDKDEKLHYVQMFERMDEYINNDDLPF